MLCLDRKPGERIHIGDDIIVEVRKVRGSRVAIAIKAPDDVKIRRGELREESDASRATHKTSTGTHQ